MKRTMLLLSISVLATLIFGWVDLAEAQQAGKVYRIGFLTGRATGGRTGASYDAFRQRLRELGFVEGQNLVIEYRYRKRVKAGQRGAMSRDAKQWSTDRGRDRLFDAVAPLAAELVRLKVDVIVISGAPSVIRAAQQATRTIPIVMQGVLDDPVKAGFVDSLARPGGNITGLYRLESKLHGKRLELLKEVFPQISRVVLLVPPSAVRQ